MKASIAKFATERPRTIYLIVMLLVAMAGALMLRLEIDTDPENMLPASQSDRVFHNAIEDRFTLHDAIVVGIVNTAHPNGIYNVESLTALHQLTDAILRLEGVIAPDLMSLSVTDNIGQEGPGTIRFEWMMRDAPVTDDHALLVPAHSFGHGRQVPLAHVERVIAGRLERAAERGQLQVAGSAPPVRDHPRLVGVEAGHHRRAARRALRAGAVRLAEGARAGGERVDAGRLEERIDVPEGPPVLLIRADEQQVGPLLLRSAQARDPGGPQQSSRAGAGAQRISSTG